MASQVIEIIYAYASDWEGEAKDFVKYINKTWKIRKIDEGDLKSLDRIDISQAYLTELSPKITYMYGLEHINLSRNSLKDLPVEFSQLRNLKRLILSSNDFRSVPSCVSDLSALQFLDVSSCALRALPEHIGRLKKLVRLQANMNSIRHVPPSFAKLENLKTCDLSDNDIGCLPPFHTLKNLRFLHLNGNRLPVLPKTTRKLTSLKTLAIDTKLSSDSTVQYLEKMGTYVTTRRIVPADKHSYYM
eukprot:CAMPEP_0167766546 /NCGR_PEP_ID=MMETSP0110_2-20121227/15410_1 /TAXON_ID=629695 /ORGANISM="Gymnochlora sp., Strain CCMP2014" /LENGTH=244 /DNA_ID=CAMNT_0007654597 /DNA_START=204 /DNA_END=938 /DNA_ORIENTATION=+